MPVEYLTPEQVSDLLQIPVGTLTQWRHRRTGPPWVKLGPKHVRYRRHDLDTWLAARLESP